MFSTLEEDLKTQFLLQTFQLFFRIVLYSLVARESKFDPVKEVDSGSHFIFHY